MDSIYVVIVLVLFVLAISDLIVGVSNDAVNFLNSAIGSKAAPFKVIMAIAAVGVLVGATFSNGMMEVARKGIMNPQYFMFSEIMIIFLAVMLTDVILLDTFNTLGLPTSTTVSIVFELLGASVGVALMKVKNDPNGIPLSDYINSGNALLIIFGILLSIVVAFSVGAFVQYLVRLTFTFDYQQKVKKFGALWGGVAITAITYFILIKGARGASFMTSQTKTLIQENTLLIIGASFLAWTFILYVLKLIAKINVLKLTVLVGTFALAMAFAGNDLVNFIGVPLAGFESFKTFKASGMSADLLKMGSLTEKVATDTYMLLIAGLIMVLTLWFSKKAKSVVKTSLDLSRQTEGDERFGSSLFARSLVRVMVRTSQKVENVVPEKISRWIDSRFAQVNLSVEPAAKAQKLKAKEEQVSFDMIRASVNLVVASILISFATSLKLPLSTTYVTFMVAMGTSLSDRAWGRESAVYRITGVVSVVGGWFFTAFAAFTVAMLVAFAIHFGGVYAIFILVLLAGFLVYRTHMIHKKSQNEEKARQEELEDKEYLEKDEIIEKCTFNVQKTLIAVSKIFGDIVKGLSKEDRKRLKETNKQVQLLNKNAKEMKSNIYSMIKKLEDDALETGQYYIQVLDYLREMAHSLTFISEPAYNHINNNHKGLLDIQVTELNTLKTKVKEFFDEINSLIDENSFDKIELVIEKQQDVVEVLNTCRKRQIKRIKKEEAGTKNSILYLGILNETKNFMLHTTNLIKSHRDFIKSSIKEKEDDSVRD